MEAEGIKDRGGGYLRIRTFQSSCTQQIARIFSRPSSSEPAPVLYNQYRRRRRWRLQRLLANIDLKWSISDVMSDNELLRHPAVRRRFQLRGPLRRFAHHFHPQTWWIDFVIQYSARFVLVMSPLRHSFSIPHMDNRNSVTNIVGHHCLCSASHTAVSWGYARSLRDGIDGYNMTAIFPQSEIPFAPPHAVFLTSKNPVLTYLHERCLHGENSYIWFLREIIFGAIFIGTPVFLNLDPVVKLIAKLKATTSQ